MNRIFLFFSLLVSSVDLESNYYFDFDSERNFQDWRESSFENLEIFENFQFQFWNINFHSSIKMLAVKLLFEKARRTDPRGTSSFENRISKFPCISEKSALQTTIDKTHICRVIKLISILILIKSTVLRWIVSEMVIPSFCLFQVGSSTITIRSPLPAMIINVSFRTFKGIFRQSV